MKLGFNRQDEHKLWHGLKDILNPICYCSIEAETTAHKDNNQISLILYDPDKLQKSDKMLIQTIRFNKGIRWGLMSNFNHNLPAS